MHVDGAVIQRVRRTDTELLRDVRLRALADAPFAFGSTVARELGFPDAFWEQRAAESEDGEHGVVFVATRGSTGIGMAGGFVPPQRQQTDAAGESAKARTADGLVVLVWGMWVDPTARRAGLGRDLLWSVLGWARQRGAVTVRLAVTEGEASAPACALYETLGFVATGERDALESNPTLTLRWLQRSLV